MVKMIVLNGIIYYLARSGSETAGGLSRVVGIHGNFLGSKCT